MTMIQSKTPPLRLTHIISGLGQGGAETMLYRLLGALDRQAFECQVISLLDQGVVGPRIAALGIQLFALQMRPGVPSLRALLQLTRLLRHLNPDVVQTWMYHADLIGGIAARLARVPRVLWNIRQSVPEPHLIKRSSRYVMGATARLSAWLPDRILCCSERARSMHIAFGYAAAHLDVIPNGFDLEILRPNPVARARLRAAWNITETQTLIGLAARFDPQKDHANFLTAALQLASCNPDCIFVICGNGCVWNNPVLAAPIHYAGLTARFRLLGQQIDMPAIYAALDLLVSASAYGEAFPNVIAEAMACGVPCVVTDVGDSAWIVGNTGRVIPPRNANALAAALAAMLQINVTDRQLLGTAARERIRAQFSLEHIAARYAAYYQRWGIQ